MYFLLQWNLRILYLHLFKHISFFKSCFSYTVKSGHCKKGWTELGESCYQFFHDTTAGHFIFGNLVPQQCATRGATGASILNLQENNFLHLLLKKWGGKSGSAHAWLGLRRSLPSKNWKWDDGTPFSKDSFTFWDSAYVSPEHECVMMKEDSGKWITGHCNGTKAILAFYFCKYRPKG